MKLFLELVSEFHLWNCSWALWRRGQRPRVKSQRLSYLTWSKQAERWSLSAQKQMRKKKREMPRSIELHFFVLNAVREVWCKRCSPFLDSVLYFYIVSPLKWMNNTQKCMKKEWENSRETQVQSSIRCLVEQPARQHMFACDARSDVIDPCVFCWTAKMDVKMNGCCVGEMRSFLVIHVDCAVCSCQNSQPNLELRDDPQSITHIAAVVLGDWHATANLKSWNRCFHLRERDTLGSQEEITLNVLWLLVQVCSFQTIVYC